MSDDLELNTLDRFTKRSDRLSLEVHSHCEVPAGCGGVVMRWIDKSLTVPLLIRFYLDGIGGLTIDGEEPSSSRPLVPYGRHVFALELEARGFMLAAIRDDGQHIGDLMPKPADATLVASCADGTWRYTDLEPAEGWALDGFDDSAWSPLVSVRIGREDNRRWEYARLTESGASPIGPPRQTGRIWVRRS